jgi:acyl-coenzyme A synthetase/AMP-(fatty) acid ligase
MNLHPGLLGIVPGGTVAICMERSFDWIVAALGIMRAGAAYVVSTAHSAMFGAHSQQLDRPVSNAVCFVFNPLEAATPAR